MDWPLGQSGSELPPANPFAAPFHYELWLRHAKETPKKEALSQRLKEKEPPLPPALHANTFPYQRNHYSWIAVDEPIDNTSPSRPLLGTFHSAHTLQYPSFHPPLSIQRRSPLRTRLSLTRAICPWRQEPMSQSISCCRPCPIG